MSQSDFASFDLGPLARFGAELQTALAPIRDMQATFQKAFEPLRSVQAEWQQALHQYYQFQDRFSDILRQDPLDLPMGDSPPMMLQSSNASDTIEQLEARCERLQEELEKSQRENAKYRRIAWIWFYGDGYAEDAFRHPYNPTDDSPDDRSIM